MIADAFRWHQYSVKQDLSRTGGLGTTLKAWTGFLRPGDTIITFNWDLLHEAALFDAKKWHYSNGYGFHCGDAPKGATSPTLLLKLRGSVNWSQSDEKDCQPSIEYKADFFPLSFDDHGKTYFKAAGKSNEGRYLIIPSFFKDLSSNQLLMNLWNQAQDALAQG